MHLTNKSNFIFSNITTFVHIAGRPEQGHTKKGRNVELFGAVDYGAGIFVEDAGPVRSDPMLVELSLHLLAFSKSLTVLGFFLEVEPLDVGGRVAALFLTRGSRRP